MSFQCKAASGPISFQTKRIKNLKRQKVIINDIPIEDKSALSLIDVKWQNLLEPINKNNRDDLVKHITDTNRSKLRHKRRIENLWNKDKISHIDSRYMDSTPKNP